MNRTSLWKWSLKPSCTKGYEQHIAGCVHAHSSWHLLYEASSETMTASTWCPSVSWTWASSPALQSPPRHCLQPRWQARRARQRLQESSLSCLCCLVLCCMFHQGLIGWCWEFGAGSLVAETLEAEKHWGASEGFQIWQRYLVWYQVLHFWEGTSDSGSTLPVSFVALAVWQAQLL